MAYFSDLLITAYEEYVEKNQENPELCAKIQAIATCTREITNTKQFLADLKQVLQTKDLPDVDLLLKLLVPLYLSIGNKNAAKKVLSSYFQSLAPLQKETALQLLCQGLQESCERAASGDASCQAPSRHVVDMIAALMDNFSVGEACVAAVSASAMKFLSKCQTYFFHQFRQGGQSAVQMNSVMHDCHVTMQVLNRLTQRHLPRDPQHLQHLMNSVFQDILQTDVQVMMEEQMMVDCRCCCAINLMLLLQIAAPELLPQIVVDMLELGTMKLAVPQWLQAVDLTQTRLSSLTPMASLALLWGMLSMLNSSTITMETENKETVSIESDCVTMETGSMETSDAKGAGSGVTGGVAERSLTCEVVLEELLNLDAKCQSTASRVQCIKTVTLWTTRMISCLRESAVSSSVRCRLKGDGETVQRLLNFVWTHWQDQLDVMRQNSRIIFDNCLKLHVLASQCEDASSDPFLLSVLQLVLEMGWSNHSKFSALTSLVQCVGARPVLCRHPHFPATLLAQMSEQGVACHASELYEVLIGQEKERGGATGESASNSNADWLSVWVDPIITQLCSSDKKLKLNIIEYILPKVMKKDKKVLEYMLTRLSSSKDTGDEQLGALIVCLRRARAWDLMSETLHTQDSAASIWRNIHCALSSPEEQVRLDAFALLCENKRTAEAVSGVEFEHLQHFITHNLNNQSPAFRQAMLSFVKKLFFRINESQQALLRLKKRKQKEKDVTPALQNYTRFLSWLEGFLFTQLYPSASFARRTMSLAILSLLAEDVHSDKDGNGYRPLSKATVNHVHTLLECLADTFEENKQEAFKLLLACTSSHTGLLSEEMCESLYLAAIQLAVSTRPQDCGTAAYIFRLLLHQPCIISIIQSHKSLPQASAFSGAGEGVTPENSKDMASGTSSEDSVPEKQTAKEESEIEKPMKKREDEGKPVSATLRLLHALLQLLVDQVNVAQTSLILAAANRPIYPTLHCIRYIMDDIDFRSLEERQKPLWSQYVSGLLQVCLQVAAVVSPVVQNSSPEGNVPEEAVLGPGLKFDLDLMAEVEESRQTVSLMPEYLVVCCWRSIKEVSLLLGQLCLRVPVTQPAVSLGLLSMQQMEEIGRYFKQQLMESLHRGAFELAYAGFVMMCQMLWKNPWSELQMLPRRWLEEVMSAITSPEESSSLCATRRSAGVPFFIQAIVATETVASGRPSFHQAMRQLLNIALSSAPSSQPANTDGQVHALNILRALFKDTRLGEDVAPYICEGLKTAILGFKSEFWEIRNSATLLLSALMTRIFGVKRSKDESVLSKRNSQTGRAFFHKYPDLYQFLLTELELATHNLGTSGHLHLHPSLYPVLMVLGRLFPSTMEGTTTRLNLAAFIPYVIRCSSSPVYKTRMMAARALQPLAGKEQVTGVLTTLLTSLPTAPGTLESRLPQSQVHGILLQVYHLLLLTADLSESHLQRLVSVCITHWQPLTWLSTRQNTCLCTRKVALDVTDLILTSTTPVKASLSEDSQNTLCNITEHLLGVLNSELQPPTTPYNPHIPFLSEFLSCVATLAMKYLCGGQKREDEAEKTVLKLLGFEAYEVHLAVLDSLLVSWTEGRQGGDGDRESLTEDDQVDPASEAVSTPPRQTEHQPVGGSDSDASCQPGTMDLGIAMTTSVVERLLQMGLQEDAHAETVVKVFQLLSVCPVTRLFSSKQNSVTVFENLLLKLGKEKSADVKAAIIQFSGCWFPILYSNLKLKADSSSETLRLLQEWSTILIVSCVAEQPDDLHISCARLLQNNCVHMLMDKDQCLGLLVFEFWSLLVTLLQADDLEVKDIAASVSARLCSSKTGGCHPEQALGELIYNMFSFHATTSMLHCLATTLSWISPHSSELDSLKSETERLFDKGELNTYQDGIALATVVSKNLEQVFNAQSSFESDSSTADKSITSYGVPFSCQSGLRLHVHSLQPTEGESGELMKVIQDVMELTELGLGLPAEEKNSVESIFLMSSHYCDHTVFLVKLAILAHSLQNLSEPLPAFGASLGDVREKLTNYVKCQVNKRSTCNLLLKLLTDTL